MLVPTSELVRRTVATETAYTVSRVQVLGRLPANPVGVAARAFGAGVVAVRARHLPYFNVVTGLGADQASLVPRVAAWFRDVGASPRVEIVPPDLTPELGRALVREGFYQSGFHTAFVVEPSQRPEMLPGQVRRVDDDVSFEMFLDAYIAGRQIEDGPGLKANIRGWRVQEGWHLYLGTVDERPAAAAILYVKDRVGYCADAATAPRFRRAGLQTALLHRRISDADAAGVDFVCSGADFLSASHRSMERVGMRVLFTRAIWTPLDDAD